MKKLITILLLFWATAGFLCAQAPQLINYQAVLRDVSGNLVTTGTVNLGISIHDAIIGGNSLYQETHSGLSANQFGLVNVKIGSGTVTSGSFSTINWGNGDKFIQIYYMGAPIGNRSQLVSVPFALYADKTNLQAGNGISVTNGNTITNTAPDQTVSITGIGSTTVSGSYPNFTISSSGGSSYTAGTGIAISGSNVISNSLSLAGTGGTTINGTFPNLTINSPIPTTYTAGTGITISGSNVISNSLSLTGTGGTTVNGTFPNLTINSPIPTTYTAGTGINISAGNQITATDASATNELQSLSISGNTLTISPAPASGNASVTLPTTINPWANYAIAEERQSNGAWGGNAAGGISNNPRALNTLTANAGTAISFSPTGGTFTLQPGSYYVRATANSFRGSTHQLIAKDIINATVLILGTSEYSGDTGGGADNPTASTLEGVINVTSGTVTFRLEHFITTNGGGGQTMGHGNQPPTSNGFGGIQSVHARCFVQKIQ